MYYKKWVSPCHFKLKALKLRLGLAGCTVAMVTYMYCVIKIITICSPIIVQSFDTMILVSTGKVRSAYEPKWPIRPELIPVSVTLNN